MASIVALVFGGCTPKVAQKTQAEMPKKNQVQRMAYDYFVSIPAHKPKLSVNEKRSLQAFLTKNASNPHAVTVYIEEVGGHSEERIKAVTSILRDHGIRRDSITVDEFDEPGSHKKQKGSGLHLIVESFVVIPPNCLNWSEELGEAKGAATTSNFGCAQAINFGMMVSDPRDLIVGRETGGYDGTRHALDINMYRTDKIKPLKVESVGSGGSSGGSSGGNSGGSN
ncbi:CpaD family pilus assembly lipoprotein [Candidatus Bealeia paramacronuclearis]